MSQSVPKPPLDEVRLKVAYKKAEDLLSEYTRSIGRGGVTLHTKKSLPVGTRFVFEMHNPGLARPVEVLGEVVRRGIRRLVVDGLTELELAIADPERRRAFLAAFSVHLRGLGVTSLFSREVSKISGTELDFSDTPIVQLGENVLLMRYVELNGRIHRILSILKMRESDYESSLREFSISAGGIRVARDGTSAEAVLRGEPPRAQKRRATRARRKRS